MKYIKEYKLFDNVESDIIQDIKDCFIQVGDRLPSNSSVNYGLKIKNVSGDRRIYAGSIPIDGDYEVMIIPKILPPEEGKIYRASSMDDELISEIENSMSLVSGCGVELKSIAVEWVTGLVEKGPGSIVKRFIKGGKDEFEGSKPYNIDLIFDFLRLKNDRIRWIKIFYK